MVVDVKKAASKTEAEDTAPVVVLQFEAPSMTPSSLRAGSGELQVSYLAELAAGTAGLDAATWNALPAADRDSRIRAEAIAYGEREKFSTVPATSDTAGNQTDVLVHAERGVGGRFIALGGGERIRVAEESTNDELIVGDAG